MSAGALRAVPSPWFCPELLAPVFESSLWCEANARVFHRVVVNRGFPLGREAGGVCKGFGGVAEWLGCERELPNNGIINCCCYGHQKALCRCVCGKVVITIFREERCGVKHNV